MFSWELGTGNASLPTRGACFVAQEGDVLFAAMVRECELQSSLHNSCYARPQTASFSAAGSNVLAAGFAAHAVA